LKKKTKVLQLPGPVDKNPLPLPAMQTINSKPEITNVQISEQKTDEAQQTQANIQINTTPVIHEMKPSNPQAGGDEPPQTSVAKSKWKSLLSKKAWKHKK